MIDITEDAQESAKVDAGSLGAISEMAVNLCNLDSEIADLEAMLKEKQIKRRRLADVDLPEAMLSLQLSSVKLANGFKLEIVDILSASISKANAPAAHEWLREQGHGDVIKTSISVEFPRGEEETARETYTELRGKNTGAVSFSENVHPQTLKKLVRELIEKGDNIPFDVFGVWTGKQAHVTQAAKGQRQ